MTDASASPTFDVAALLNAARDRSSEGRARLFGLLGRLFLTRGAELNDADRRGFTALLTLLRPMADIETRLELAHATAEVPSAPTELARLLAEDEIEVAALVLFGADALGATELIALAEDEDRARIIAGRRHLPMMVADALMRRADGEIARTLLQSEGSKLSIPALDTAIELARADPYLQQRIARRPELLEEMAKDMLDWVEPSVRAHLVERFEFGSPPTGLKAAEIETRLRSLLGLDIEELPLPEPPVAAVEAGPAVMVADPRFRLAPREVSEALRGGDLVRAEAMFAHMAGIPTPLIRRFAKQGDGESTALAARGIGMSREEFATLYLLWRKARSPNGLVSAGELGNAVDRFDSAPEERVDAAMAGWRGGGRTDSFSA